jgi:hypothetical protein
MAVASAWHINSYFLYYCLIVIVLVYFKEWLYVQFILVMELLAIASRTLVLVRTDSYYYSK